MPQFLSPYTRACRATTESPPSSDSSFATSPPSSPLLGSGVSMSDSFLTNITPPFTPYVSGETNNIDGDINREMSGSRVQGLPTREDLEELDAISALRARLLQGVPSLAAQRALQFMDRTTEVTRSPTELVVVVTTPMEDWSSEFESDSMSANQVQIHPPITTSSSLEMVQVESYDVTEEDEAAFFALTASFSIPDTPSLDLDDTADSSLFAQGGILHRALDSPQSMFGSPSPTPGSIRVTSPVLVNTWNTVFPGNSVFGRLVSRDLPTSDSLDFWADIPVTPPTAEAASPIALPRVTLTLDADRPVGTDHVLVGLGLDAIPSTSFPSEEVSISPNPQSSDDLYPSASTEVVASDSLAVVNFIPSDSDCMASLHAPLAEMVALLDSLDQSGFVTSSPLARLASVMASEDAGYRLSPTDFSRQQPSPSSVRPQLAFRHTDTRFEDLGYPQLFSSSTLASIGTLRSVASNVGYVFVSPRSASQDAFFSYPVPAVPDEIYASALEMERALSRNLEYETNAFFVSAASWKNPSYSSASTQLITAFGQTKVPFGRSPGRASPPRPFSSGGLAPTHPTTPQSSLGSPTRSSPSAALPAAETDSRAMEETASNSGALVATGTTFGPSEVSSTSAVKKAKSMEGLGLGLPTDLCNIPCMRGASRLSVEAPFEPRMSSMEGCMDLSALAIQVRPASKAPQPVSRKQRSVANPTRFLRPVRFAPRELYVIDEVSTPSPVSSTAGRPPSPSSLGQAPLTPVWYDFAALIRLSRQKKRNPEAGFSLFPTPPTLVSPPPTTSVPASPQSVVHRTVMPRGLGFKRLVRRLRGLFH